MSASCIKIHLAKLTHIFISRRYHIINQPFSPLIRRADNSATSSCSICTMIFSLSSKYSLPQSNIIFPATYFLSPLMRRESWISFGMMVTRLAWMAHRFESSFSPTRYASDASCRARTADPWNRRLLLKSMAISRTRRWKGSLRMRRSVDF